MLEKRQDTPEHAADNFLMYVRSSIVHCLYIRNGVRPFLN